METFSNTSIKGADINLKLGLVVSDSLKRAYWVINSLKAFGKLIIIVLSSFFLLSNILTAHKLCCKSILKNGPQRPQINWEILGK